MTIFRYILIISFVINFNSVAVSFGQNPTILISEVMISNGDVISDEFGEFDDWVEIFNYGDLDVDLKGLSFSDSAEDLDKMIISESIIIPPQSYYLLWADGTVDQGESHLNFRLSSKDDFYISDDTGIIDFVDLGTQQHNISFGRPDLNGSLFSYFTEPTPGQANNTTAYELLSRVEASIPTGNYESAISVELSQPESAQIFYTLDGSTPNESSKLYNGDEILIESNTILRAIAYDGTSLPPWVSTYTYIFNESSTIPILFVASQGNIINSEEKQTVHAELIDEYGVSLFSSNVTTQKHGHDDQISFRFLMGTKHGGEKVYNSLFGSKPDVDEFKSLIFRQAGNDGLNTSNTRRAHMRDGFSNSIINRGDFNFKASGFRQVNVYLDGEYHGLFNMRERVDASFLDNNYDIKSTDPKCFIEYKFDVPNNINPIEGSWSYFNDNLYSRCLNADLSDDVEFEKATANLNIEDFTDYWIHQVFIGNFDWLTNNMFFWSPIGRNEKFRWILWDTDVSFGLNGDPDWNSLDWATSTEDGRPQNGDRTAIIRGLLTNEQYQTYFITRFCDLLNKEYDPDYLMILLDNLSETVEDEVAKHIEKWGKGSLDTWHDALQRIKAYAQERPHFVREHIKSKFSYLTEMYRLDLDCSIEGAGYFKLNTIDVETEIVPWEGLYFDQLPLELEVFANEGYKFVGWANSQEKETKIKLNPQQDTSLVALFELESESEFEVVITELSYTQIEGFDSGDWVEFFNASPTDIDISGWQFEDSSTNKEVFIFPEGTVIGANDYFVVVRDIEKFQKVYPQITNIYGNTDFGLSRQGETIRLYDSNQDLVDRVFYLSDNTWPESNENNSIQLIDVELDNNKGSSWVVSPVVKGTPGAANSILSSLGFYLEGASNQLNIFPNPATYFIQLNDVKDGFLEVYDIHGKLNLLITHDSSTGKIDVSTLDSGYYILRYRERNGKFFIGQIVKE